MSEGKTCFVISPIGEPDSEIRKRSDQILDYIITPAVRECGYDPLRADQISQPGIITTQVIQHIVDDPLVIADLTNHNPNVFYELAIRHAVKKPVVQIIQKGERIPFDVAPIRTISVDYRDLATAAKAKEEIMEQIKAVEEDPSKIDTPISVALDLQILKSGSPEQRSLADMVETISQLRSDLLDIYSNLAESDASVRYVSDQILAGIRDLSQRSPHRNTKAIMRTLLQLPTAPSKLDNGQFVTLCTS
ncbi:MAG: hypothetical protein E3J21_01315, partial [Anaerolineales bacterium]